MAGREKETMSDGAAAMRENECHDPVCQERGMSCELLDAVSA